MNTDSTNEINSSNTSPRASGGSAAAKKLSAVRARKIGGMPVFDLICALVLAVIVSSVIYAVIPAFLENTNLFNEEQYLDLGLEEDESIDDTSYSCELPYSYDNVRGIALTCDSYGTSTQKRSENTITVTVRDSLTGEVVATAERLALYTRDGDGLEAEFYFDSVLLQDEDDEYVLEIASGDEFQLTAIGVLGYNDGATQKSIFYIILLILIGAMILMAYEAFVSREFATITAWDLGVIALLLATCSLMYSQGLDISVTITHAKELLYLIRTGSVGEFYTYAFLGTGTAAMYNIVLYLFTGIAVVPYWLFGILFGIEWNDSVAVIYFCFVLSMIVLVSAYLVCGIARDMGFREDNAKRTSFLYLSSIVLLFGSVGFAQLDIVYICVVLLAIRFYLRRRYILFSLIMSVGIMLKILPILIFVPLILLVEKRVFHILKYLLLGLSCKILCALTIENAIDYKFYQELLDYGYGFSGRIFAGSITGGKGSIAVFLAIFMLVCLWCYETKPDHQTMWKYVILAPLITYSAVIIFVQWHPQWVVMITPFIALALGCGRKRPSLLYCEFGIGVFYWLFCLCYFGENVDNYMVNYGILPLITGHTFAGIPLATVFSNITQYASVAFFTLLAALTVYYTFMMTRDIMGMDCVTQYQDTYWNRGTVLARCAFMCGICLVYTFMYFYVG